jgi:hypothetical protein
MSLLNAKTLLCKYICFSTDTKFVYYTNVTQGNVTYIDSELISILALNYDFFPNIGLGSTENRLSGLQTTKQK